MKELITDIWNKFGAKHCTLYCALLSLEGSRVSFDFLAKQIGCSSRYIRKMLSDIDSLITSHEYTPHTHIDYIRGGLIAKTTVDIENTGSNSSVATFQQNGRAADKPVWPKAEMDIRSLTAEESKFMEQAYSALSALTGRRYYPKREDYADFKQVISKHTMDDIKVVINMKCDEWLDDVKMNKFLRPQTIFKPTNFQKYYDESRIYKQKSSTSKFSDALAVAQAVAREVGGSQ